MTERRSRRHKPSALPVVVISLTVFLVVLTLLTLQLRAGHDPALSAARGAPAKRRVLVRRIERKTVIERVIPADDGGGDDGSAGGAPVVSSSTAASPDPGAYAAAAPAPVTRSS